MTCGQTFYACVCSVEGEHTTHHCIEVSAIDGEPCDGLWRDHDDQLLAWVVRYPVAGAREAGIAQPIEPVAEPRVEPPPAPRRPPFRRGAIAPYEAIETTATEL